jgi:hypothetical protein
VDDASGAPIRALLFDDDSLLRLDAFVAELGESIDAIQDSEHGGHLDETAKRAADLAREAGSLGLPELAATAELVVTCCQDDAMRAHAAIVELTDVVRRVRLGHRPPL